MKRLLKVSMGVLVVGMTVVSVVSAQTRDRSDRRASQRRRGLDLSSESLVGLFGQEWFSDLLGRDLKRLPAILKMTEPQRASYEKQAKAYTAEIEPLLKQLREKSKKFRANVGTTLTDRQRSQFSRLRDYARIRMMGRRRRYRPAQIERAVGEIELSDEAKKEKVIQLAREAREKIRRLDKKDRGKASEKILNEMTEQIRQELGPQEFKLLADKVRETTLQRFRARRGRGKPRAGQE